MNSNQKFYMDDSFGEKETTETSKNIQTIIELYQLLSVEDKVQCKRLINQEKLF